MKKKIRLIGLVILGCLSVFLYFNQDKKEDKEADFQFSLSYNVGGKDFVSTYEKILTQDTVEGLITKDFQFSEEDLDTIEAMIRELGLMEDDFGLIGQPGLMISPMGVYDLKIQLDGQTKHFYWTSGHMNPNLKVGDDRGIKFNEVKRPVEFLMDFKNLIIDLIRDYDVYKEMPRHRMYL